MKTKTQKLGPLLSLRNRWREEYPFIPPITHTYTRAPAWLLGVTYLLIYLGQLRGPNPLCLWPNIMRCREDAVTYRPSFHVQVRIPSSLLVWD